MLTCHVPVTGDIKPNGDEQHIKMYNTVKIFINILIMRLKSVNVS